MNDLTVFENQQFGSVRAVMKDGEPWFVAADVCKSLGLEQVSRAMDRLDSDERGLVKVTHPQNTEKLMDVNAVTEAGLYHLIICSTKPEAKAFKRWITHDVIPAIRKTGAYMTPETIEKVLLNPDTIISLASQIKQLQAEVKANAPAVLFTKSVETAKTSILVGDLAKVLRQNGAEMGQQRLFAWMRDTGYLMSTRGSWNMPTQYSMELGLMEVKETVINNPDGSVRVTRTPKITGKGQVYFVNKILNSDAYIDDDQASPAFRSEA